MLGRVFCCLNACQHRLQAVTERFDVPVIGIGAGVDTDGQVLVARHAWHLYPKTRQICQEFFDR